MHPISLKIVLVISAVIVLCFGLQGFTSFYQMAHNFLSVDGGPKLSRVSCMTRMRIEDSATAEPEKLLANLQRTAKFAKAIYYRNAVAVSLSRSDPTLVYITFEYDCLTMAHRINLIIDIYTANFGGTMTAVGQPAGHDDLIDLPYGKRWTDGEVTPIGREIEFLKKYYKEVLGR